MTEPQVLSIEEVKHVARLARLRIPDEQLEQRRIDLSAILSHVAALHTVDVTGVEPLTRPLAIVNRLSADEPVDGLSREALLKIAPAVEGPYVAVPKVLDESS